MQLRASQIAKLETQVFDALVIGGGVNGAVTAAALSGRGVTTALIDAGDFASGVSQQSSNLAWGGIKYMESFEFGLVRKLCISRNHLMRSYPSSVKEIRFFTTHEKNFRHSLWKLFAGTWLYWFMGNGFTKKPRVMSPAAIRSEEPVINVQRCDGGFEYSDAFFRDNDARFVFQLIRSAMDSGCVAANYLESMSAVRETDGLWHVSARDNITGKRIHLRAKAVVNACGVFVDEHNKRLQQQTQHRHVFSKGVHLIVDRITENSRVLTFFADDSRLFFAIPMGNKTCIGTTDTRVESPVPVVTDEDRKFVLDNLNKRLQLEKPLTNADIIAERCGARPLVVRPGDGESTDWLQLSRKHVIESNVADKYVSVFGGKLTDCINVGEALCTALGKMGISLPHPKRRWYGEPAALVRTAFLERCALMRIDRASAQGTYEKLSERLWRRYGEQAFAILDDIQIDPESTQDLIEGAEYAKCELRHCARREMVVTLEDFLRRRTNIELTVRQDKLRTSEGLWYACQSLFGANAQREHDAYFSSKQMAASR